MLLGLLSFRFLPSQGGHQIGVLLFFDPVLTVMLMGATICLDLCIGYAFTGKVLVKQGRW